MGTVFRSGGSYADAADVFAEGAQMIKPYADQFPGSLYERVYTALRKYLAEVQAELEKQQKKGE